MEAIAPSLPVPLWRRILGGLGSVRLLDLRTGHWFDRVLTQYVRNRPARPMAFAADSERQAASDAITRWNAAEAALLGAATAGISTAAAIVATDVPWGGLVTAPVAAAAIGAEMVARAVLHVRMSCALADAWAIRFSPEDPDDLARLYALAFDVEEPRDEVYGGTATIERLSRNGRDTDLGNAIGSKLLSESILRNLPFVGVFTSAVQSWRVTMHVGGAVTRYLRFRHLFDDVLARVAAHGPEAVDALVEGVWYIAIADGQPNDDETALLAHLVRTRPRESRWKLTARFVGDSDAWLARLARVPERAHDDLFSALGVAATIDGALAPGERQLLARAAAALGVEPAAEPSEPPQRRN